MVLTMKSEFQQFPDAPGSEQPVDATADMEVRLARSRDEVDAAQRLRYRVFYEERGMTLPSACRALQDEDDYDAAMQHMVVIDRGREDPAERVVGTYRLRTLRDGAGLRDVYSSREFDLTPLLGFQRPMLELGRSCVLAPYRRRGVMNLLWKAIAGYVAENEVQLLFGCASIPATNPDLAREQLVYLHSHHLAPPALRPRARGPHAVMPDSDAFASTRLEGSRTFFSLEPLLKGYLRLGAYIGEGAYVDADFGTIDVCIVMPTDRLADRYARHFLPSSNVQAARRQQPASAIAVLPAA